MQEVQEQLQLYLWPCVCVCVCGAAGRLNWRVLRVWSGEARGEVRICRNQIFGISLSSGMFLAFLKVQIGPAPGSLLDSHCAVG